MASAETDITEIKSDLKEVLVTVTDIKSTMDQAKGGWKTLAWASGISGVGGAFVAKLSTIVGFIPAK